MNGSQDNVYEAVKIWEERRNKVLEELDGLPVIPAAGCWSMLIDVGKMGYTGMEASNLLLERGRVAATHMTNWGDVNSSQFVRLVFSNESVKRLSGLRQRFDKSL